MAYNTRSIGSFTFAFLDGLPQQKQELVQTLERVGVDGHAYRLIGQRLPEFTLTSKVSVSTAVATFELIEDYQDAIGGAPLALVWEGLNLTTDAGLTTNYKVMVLGVRVVSITAPARMVGNVTSGHLVWLTCEWTLQMVEV